MNKLLFIFILSAFILTAGKQINSSDVFGFCGTLLNSFVLYIGYSERQTFIKPVNAMIWSVKHLKNP